MTRQDLYDTIESIAIEHGAFIIDDCLCGDGMDIIAFAVDVIQQGLPTYNLCRN